MANAWKELSQHHCAGGCYELPSVCIARTRSCTAATTGFKSGRAVDWAAPCSGVLQEALMWDGPALQYSFD